MAGINTAATAKVCEGSAKKNLTTSMHVNQTNGPNNLNSFTKSSKEYTSLICLKALYIKACIIFI